MQKYILSAYTTLLTDVGSHGFDYVKGQVSLPYSGIFVNFMSIIYNSFYGALLILRN